jgi:enoyl-CoA hydratase
MSGFQSEVRGEILFLKFSVPQAGNSLSLQDARDLSALLKKHKSARGLILSSGIPRLFCAGGRLSDYAKLKEKSQGLNVNREITRHLDTLAKWPGLKMAIVNGDCYGGGMEWISCFDFRWTIPSAFFCFWQRRIGLTPGWGGGRRWAALLGDGALHSRLLSSEIFGAGEALRSHIVDRVVSEDKIFRQAEEWLASALALNAVIPRTWSAKSEAKVFSQLWWQESHRAALKKWR